MTRIYREQCNEDIVMLRLEAPFLCLILHRYASVKNRTSEAHLDMIGIGDHEQAAAPTRWGTNLRVRIETRVLQRRGAVPVQ